MANTGPCTELAAPSEKVIRLNCSKPSKRAKQLIIDCTARPEQLHLCEVKVYGEYRVVALEPLSMPEVKSGESIEVVALEQLQLCEVKVYVVKCAK